MPMEVVIQEKLVIHSRTGQQAGFQRGKAIGGMETVVNGLETGYDG